MQNKIRVLALGDYCCTTGFASVMSNIMQELHATGKYEIDVVGINFTGDPYDLDRFPGNVYPALNISNMHTNDPYGRQKVLDMLGTGDYDIFFTVQDTFIIQTFIDKVVETQASLIHKFKTIFYFPFDAIPKPEWIEKCVALVDYPVTYTEYSRALVLDIMPGLAPKLDVIYHGTNLDDFFYIEDREEVTRFRTSYFAGKADDKVLITNVNRNQIRKDPARNFMIMAELKRRGIDNVIFYLHMSHDDAGGNLLVMAENFGLKLQEDFILPSPKFFNANRGISVDVMNMIYNASDAVITTTLGEGWGLSITEAMATKTPVIAPENTSIAEILADNRGMLVKSGADPSMWITLGGNDNERVRPLMDVSDAADKIEAFINGQKPDIDKAYAFARHYTWKSISEQWAAIFDKAAEASRTATSTGVTSPNRQQRRKVKNKKKR